MSPSEPPRDEPPRDEPPRDEPPRDEPPRDEPPRDEPEPAELERFTLVERWAHRATGLLMGAAVLSAAVLYVGPLSVLVGRRDLVVGVHVAAGILLPAPMLVAWLSPAFRADVRELNRFQPMDVDWLRHPKQRSRGFVVGKFHPGQKLYAAFTAGAILVMFGTGLIMRYAQSWPISLRTGATFVHDWLAFAVVVGLAAHMWLAANDPVARLGMRTGRVPRAWVLAKHPGWDGPDSGRLISGRGGQRPGGPAAEPSDRVAR